MFVSGDTNKHLWIGLRMKNFRVVIILSLIFLPACVPAADNMFTEFSEPPETNLKRASRLNKRLFWFFDLARQSKALFKANIDRLF
jgi:hypothetical protein